VNVPPDEQYMRTLAALGAYVNLEATGRRPSTAPPTLDRMRALVALMAEPQDSYPVLHLTGTNGKTSTARILTSLLVAQGLSVGTYTSPHLERINERFAWNGDPISDDSFASVVGAVLELADLMAEPPWYFEVLAASAFRWFADIAVDAAVVEVGMLGRWDATNVVNAAVAVITNIGADHLDYAGDLEGVAYEKAGIVKPGCTLVVGEPEERWRSLFDSAGAAAVWRREEDFACVSSSIAHGGRLLDLRTPGSSYDGIFLPLHGLHQGNNAACALTAAEALFGTPLSADVVEAGFARVTSPGRLEVAGRRPLVLLDGAHNVDGADALGVALTEEFATLERWILVLGSLRGHDPGDLLRALDPNRIHHVVACQPDWGRALPADEVAAAARDAGVTAEVVADVGAAVATAIEMADEDDLVLVTGSLYVVGEARAALLGG